MTLLSYQVFQTVVEQGSFQKAAEVLHLTPSAVSHAVSAMEQELGFSLFTRNKGGVSLTNYGEHLLPYMNAVLNSDESLKQAIAGLNPAAIVLLLALLGGCGVFAYLKLVKNKPKTKGNDSLDDYDYGEEDSEEWETEDEEVLEDGFEGSDPNEERDRAD